jgi:pilus assembly protein Flp/PilA
MLARFQRFLANDEAATAVEYAVMLALILIAVLGAVTALGQNTNGLWTSNNTNLKTVGFGS